MRKILFAVLVFMMTLSMIFTSFVAGPSEAVALGGTVSSKNLPVIKLPADMAAASVSEPSLAIKPLARKPPVQADNKWAVVIGIADYKGTGSDLWHPDEDAAEMASALINNFGFASDHIKVLKNSKATANAILSAISWLAANEDSNSTVVFFYSGHGFRAPDSEGWDSDLESDGNDEGIVSFDLYGLPDGLLKQRFAVLESKKIALLFGSCHSGGMFDQAGELQGDNRLIAAACKADQYGWDYWELGNTLWGKYFVDEGLLHKAAASLEGAHAYAYPRVINEQLDSQPQLYDNYTDEFIP